MRSQGARELVPFAPEERQQRPGPVVTMRQIYALTGLPKQKPGASRDRSRQARETLVALTGVGLPRLGKGTAVAIEALPTSRP